MAPAPAASSRRHAGRACPWPPFTARRTPRLKPTASTAVAARSPPAHPEGGKPMTAVAVELLPAPPAPDTLDPDAVELIADTDKLMVMCSCSSSSDAVY